MADIFNFFSGFRFLYKMIVFEQHKIYIKIIRNFIKWWNDYKPYLYNQGIIDKMYLLDIKSCREHTPNALLNEI